ncbi:MULTISPECIES: hypothetical protein [Geobacteraceae]|uniref:Large ATP-binding protein n=1 Tax=Geotalea uraniireducens TaxID=351604 RepID=A0ABM8EJK6_9BACT|nr:MULTISPECIES: hypothetical protein [Geobacteraceae]BDV42678.1 hypothetical protein GURASL_16010 [Geotalea uraniireducens]HML78992.1 hypothetical protein [Geobacter sulfurreducens]
MCALRQNQSKEWAIAISEKAGVDKGITEEILSACQIRPSPVIATPRRLLLRRIRFSGEKEGPAEQGPFEFNWSNLNTGLWALVTESNLKGKSTVIEVVRWMLRGRPSENLQRDVRSWITDVSVTFDFDGVGHEVQAKTTGGVIGKLVRIDGESNRQLATFESDDEFEAVMSDFFLRELSLEPVTLWLGGSEEEGGKAVTHEWPWLSGAMFIGTDYSSLLGDVYAGGLSTKLMQMYLGLPWISTLSNAKTAQQAMSREKESRDRRRKSAATVRKTRTDSIIKELEVKRKNLASIPSDEKIREDLSKSNNELAIRIRSSRMLEDRLEKADRASKLAEQEYADDRRELQTFNDAEAACQVFRMLDPSFCPRCDTAITQERKKQEKTHHACSVCGESITSEADVHEAKAAIEHRVKASKSALEKVQKEYFEIKKNLEILEQEKSTFRTKCVELENKLGSFAKRRELEIDVRMLEARLEEAAFDPEPEEEGINQKAQVIDAAVAETDRRVKAIQVELLKDVSTKIVKYAQRFGMVNLSDAELKGNASLPLVKGGRVTSYSKVTAGEKLRLKVAAVLAMLSVAEAKGLGRHPGLLMIDSPGAHEVTLEDLEELISGLVEVSKELPHLQVFIAALASPAITGHVSKQRLQYATGHEPLW